MVVNYFKDDSIVHFPLPEIAQAMEFRATQLEIENDLEVIEKVLRENLLATLSK
jgi:hypothetical protein